MKRTGALFFVFAIQACSLAHASYQAPSTVGSWKIDITFTDTSTHTLRFDADEAGKGSFLLLDRISSLLDPPVPTKAEWEQIGVAVNLSGLIEFPIGNVGRDTGTLVFAGAFEASDSITGNVAFFRGQQNPKDPNAAPAKTGTFRAARITVKGTTTVELLSLNSGGKVRGGTQVEINWQVASKMEISAQQLFLSIDRGETFAPISDILDGEDTQFTWTVPEIFAKKSKLKIVVVDAVGDIAEDTSPQTFKIR